MSSYKLPADPRAELIIKLEYPKVKAEAKKIGILGEVILSYCSAASEDPKTSSKGRGCFNREGDLSKCLAGLNAARKKVGWDEINLENLVVENKFI